MAQASASAQFWLEDERQTDLIRRLWGAVAGSLVLHVGALVIVAWVRLPQHGERPLASIEVSLAALPSPPTKAVDSPKSQPKSVESPSPAPRVKAAPVPVPPVSVKVPAGDVMKNVELPPDVPKFGDVSPAERPTKKPFKLPDVPAVPEMMEPASTLSESKPRPLLTDDLQRELDEELRNLKKIDLLKAAPPESLPKPVPSVEAKVPSVKAVDATLKISGVAPGSSAYLGRVRQRISSFWNAPPVDVTAQTYVVVVQFRLHRNGSVTGVEIERSSGNEYYDLAGKRAVLNAVPLPAFPPEVSEPYFDAHFTFTVGDSQG